MGFSNSTSPVGDVLHIYKEIDKQGLDIGEVFVTAGISRTKLKVAEYLYRIRKEFPIKTVKDVALELKISQTTASSSIYFIRSNLFVALRDVFTPNTEFVKDNKNSRINAWHY